MNSKLKSKSTFNQSSDKFSSKYSNSSNSSKLKTVKKRLKINTDLPSHIPESNSYILHLYNNRDKNFNSNRYNTPKQEDWKRYQTKYPERDNKVFKTGGIIFLIAIIIIAIVLSIVFTLR